MQIAPPDLALTEHHRDQFPALANKAYFNYGGQGPMPQAALDAIQQAHVDVQEAGPFSAEVNRWVIQQADETRQMMAMELGVPVETMTLTEDVTVGCNIPLWGIAWQSGDHVLLTDCEHPGVIATVEEICRRFGVEMSFCPILATLNAGNPAEVIAEHLRPNTRLVIVSHILWNTGQVLPLTDIVKVCHQARTRSGETIRVLVDAAQSVGSLPLNLSETGVDFYAFTGHKWWCGPAGIGGLYVSPTAREQIHPTFIGWRGITTDAAANPTGFKPNGQRFEIATSDYTLYPALRAAIATHNHWGTAQARYQQICMLSRYLWRRLKEMPPVHCLSEHPPQSGLVSFQLNADADVAPKFHSQLVQILEQQGFMLRTLLSPNCVRACVHYFTLESEIDRLVETIQRILVDGMEGR